jgi:hypothetical protein
MFYHGEEHIFLPNFQALQLQVISAGTVWIYDNSSATVRGHWRHLRTTALRTLLLQW